MTNFWGLPKSFGELSYGTLLHSISWDVKDCGREVPEARLGVLGVTDWPLTAQSLSFSGWRDNYSVTGKLSSNIPLKLFDFRHADTELLK